MFPVSHLPKSETSCLDNEGVITRNQGVPNVLFTPRPTISGGGAGVHNHGRVVTSTMDTVDSSEWREERI